MKTQQAIIPDHETPAPGEPLKHDVHVENEAVLEDARARRMEMIRAKLSRHQHRRITVEYRKLHRRLNRARYNDLVKQHDDLRERYAYELSAYRESQSPQQKALIEKIRRDGLAVKRRLAALAGAAARFEALAARLDAHQRVIRMEREDTENRKAFFKEAAVWEQQIKAVFRQSKRLHYVREGKNGPVIVIPQIDHIIIKEDRVYYRIRINRQSWLDKLLGVWQNALPYNMDVRDLTCDETLENLTAACGRVVSVERNQRSQNIYYVINRLDSPDGIPKSVTLDQIIAYNPEQDYQKTPWIAGIGENRTLKTFDFVQYPNLLIAGAAGGGKSNLVNAILCQLIAMNEPSDLRLALIDNKGGVELSHFDGVPHLLMPTIIGTAGVLPALCQIREVMQKRYALMHKVSAKDLIGYNKKVTDTLPRIIVVIDEMATLLAIPETADIHNELRVISSQGRAAGIHLIISTQHPSVDVLPGWIKTNLTLRMATRMPNHTASQIVVDSITAAHLPEVPGRMVVRRGGFEDIIQTPFVDDDTIARYVGVASEMPVPAWQLAAATVESDADESAAAIVPPPEPAPRRRFGYDEYIKMALEIGGSLSSLRIYNSGANQFLSQSECAKLGKSVIERLLNQGDVEIDGVMYTMQRSGRGWSLVAKLTDLLDETGTDVTDTLNKSKKSNKPQEIEVYETA